MLPGGSKSRSGNQAGYFDTSYKRVMGGIYADIGDSYFPKDFHRKW